MKKLILMACVAIGLQTHAQYFDHDYGSTTIDEPQRGMNTVAMGEGFVISGLGTNTAGTATGSIVARSNAAGMNSGAPYFTNGYRVRTVAGTPMNSRDARILEQGPNSFGLSGACVIPATGVDYAYHLQLNPNGPVLNAHLYFSQGYSFYRITSVASSTTANQQYMAGSAIRNFTGETQIVVMKISFNGNIAWASIYDMVPGAISNEVAYDLAEDAATGELIVVGQTTLGAGTSDAFLLRLNPATGAVIGANTYGTAGSNETFTGIELSNDAANNNGYIISGYTDNTSAADVDGWLVRIDNTLATLWANTYDYNASAVNNYFYDVKERLNTSGNYEYYAGGTTSTGATGTVDIEVDKTAVNGASVGQFTYGTTVGESLVSIDVNTLTTVGAVNGISMYGYRSTGLLGSSDLTIYKAYFNGITSCDYSTNTITEATGPGFLSNPSPNLVAHLIKDTATVNTSAGLDKTKCYSTTVTGGSNARMAQGKQAQLAMELDVLTTGEAGSYQVQIENALAGKAEIRVNDLMGRVVYSKTMELQEGSNNIPVELGANTGAGIYILNTTVSGKTYSNKLVVVK
ncbi:MAG: hypothetical protein K0S33_2747 [Bacteroidetes bacterium]|jgi:hypothetical protein|nr:hypothetical protein [Bacteroidota bacterium]